MRFHPSFLALPAILLATASAAAPPPPQASVPSQARIIGGTDAPAGAYPFLVSVQLLPKGSNMKQRHWCGGSVISPHWVLTAAHCVEGRQPGDFAIAAGVASLDENDGVQHRTITAVHVPAWFAGGVSPGDAALLRLDEPLEDITPIRLIGSEGSSYEQQGRLLTVAGWGSIVQQPGGGRAVYPSRLQHVDVPFVATATCSRLMNISADLHVCAGDTLLDACQGDSGGPLFTLAADGRWVQLGIVSWGSGCGAKDAPGIYSRLAADRIDAFIQQTWTRD